MNRYMIEIRDMKDHTTVFELDTHIDPKDIDVIIADIYSTLMDALIRDLRKEDKKS